jgi:2,4-dienoyl-CoA reductase-like NADH-dependent reductase (Old Yellow Enzyme family)
VKSAMATDVATPLVLQNLTLKNRIAKGAMSEALAPRSGRVTKGLLKLYDTWGKGDLGLAISGNVMIDIRAKNEPGVVVIEDESDLLALTRWAAIGKMHNMVQIVQLSHPGKQAPKGLNKETVSPSAVGFGADLATYFGTPRALEEAEILEIIRRFGESSRICKKAGFDGVQLHGAHGYLINQFLSPIHNRRVDRWGGCLDNRMRFVIECFKEVRKQTGPDFVVAIKLNSSDFQKGGFSEEDSLAVFKALDALGIDFIEISGGTYEAPAMAGVTTKPVKESTTKREAYFLDFAERVRNEVKTVLMLTGGFRTRAAMNAALASGACDLVGIARPLAVETDAPRRIVAGGDMRHGIQPIKTGIELIDKMPIMAMMEVVWYAAQLKSVAKGGVPNPKLSPLRVLAAYCLNNLRAVVQRRTRTRA